MTPTLRALMGAMGTMSSLVGRGPGESPQSRHVIDPSPFDAFVVDLRARVETHLVSWLEARVADARARGPEVFFVADALRQLVLRGGKRMRAVLLGAGYLACGGDDIASVLPAGACLELLQAYLLTHDDWMDGDEMRRGGPSVPAMMRARFGGSGGSSDASGPAAILAGDLAASWALTSMLELAVAPARVVLAARELARVEQDVVEGQVLDVCAGPRDGRDVETTYALKTASYTVRAPIVIGARLAGADDCQASLLAGFAEPLGIAFQLRDDLLGAFGDPRATGKPSAGDLRKGKRTALVLEAMQQPEAARRLGRVLGHRDASEVDLAAALEALEACGARSRIEKRIEALAVESRAALGRASITTFGRELLGQAIVALTERDR